MNSQNNLDNIEHIVVLMMENRSFDNILGWLYDYENNPPPFDKPPKGSYNGVNSSMKNPTSPKNGSYDYVNRGTDFTAPFPDPNEEYEFVYRQMYNQPLENSVNQPPPHIQIPNTTATPSMDGFVIDYTVAIEKANIYAKKHNKPGFDVDPGTIMNCFAPESLPVINTLAKSYAVCDNWFCSVPTQTFPNRSFVHAATSSGNVYNSWKDEIGLPGVFINHTTTIYNHLEKNPEVSWKIYYGGHWYLCNALYGQSKLWKYILPWEPKRFFPLFSGDFSSDPNLSQANQFCEDVKAGKLANYTFIEPNMMCSSKYGPENDMHPAFAVKDTGKATNVLYGDKLIHDIYNALRSNEEVWNKTLLIITFDEHGGCFDHVSPPTCETSPQAVPPDDKPPKPFKKYTGRSGFDFKRLGVRVPAVLISPRIEQGTISNTLFDHTSIIKTVSKKWLGGENLTNRDGAANDLSEILSLSSPRTDCVEITPKSPPPFDGCKGKSLSPFQSDKAAASLKMLLELKKLKTDSEKAGITAEMSEISDSIPEDVFEQYLKELNTTEDVTDTLGSIADDLLEQ